MLLAVDNVHRVEDLHTGRVVRVVFELERAAQEHPTITLPERWRRIDGKSSVGLVTGNLLGTPHQNSLDQR